MPSQSRLVNTKGPGAVYPSPRRAMTGGGGSWAAQKKELDFFLVSEPAWLDEKFSSQAAKVGRPCAALVSTDQQWIT